MARRGFRVILAVHAGEGIVREILLLVAQGSAISFCLGLLMLVAVVLMR